MRCLLVFLCFSLLTSCGSEDGDENKTPLEKLFSGYNPLTTPFNIADSTLQKSVIYDTANITLFKQLVPDSVFDPAFGQDRKLKLFAIGKIEQEQKESYLVTLAKSKSKSAVFLTVFDKGNFMTNLPLIVSDQDDIVNVVSIDKKLSVAINKEWTSNNNFYYNRIIYAYNNVGVFTTVLTETNEDRTSAKNIVNPLDTFPKKNKYSADYAMGKNNFLYLRDGNIPNEYQFYVYFENENEGQPCSGELKGRFMLTSDKEGTFSGTGEPCVLNFSFNGNEVLVKETGTCGNYRGIKCFFNHSFTKRKDPKPLLKKK